MLTLLLTATDAAAESAPEGINPPALHEWNIVVPENAIESEVFTAQEFHRLYKQASGVELPIVRRIARPNRHVFIGPGAEMRGSTIGFDVQSFSQEDLRIVARNQNIAIAGGRPRGTLYGVYTFLEDYLGISGGLPRHTVLDG